MPSSARYVRRDCPYSEEKLGNAHEEDSGRNQGVGREATCGLHPSDQEPSTWTKKEDKSHAKIEVNCVCKPENDKS